MGLLKIQKPSQSSQGIPTASFPKNPLDLSTPLSQVLPKGGKLFQKLMGDSVFEALCHLPTNIITYETIENLSASLHQRYVNLQVTVLEHIPAKRHGSPHKIRCVLSNRSDFLDLVFFYPLKLGRYLLKTYPTHRSFWIKGRLEYFHGHYQIAHPQKLTYPPTQQEKEIIYPLTAGLSSQTIGSAIHRFLEQSHFPEEWHSPEYGYPSLKAAFEILHHGQEENSLSPHNPAYKRLLHDELLAHQLALQQGRCAIKSQNGIPIHSQGSLAKAIQDILPFTLTQSQKNALEDIQNDIAKPHPMLRLLQGDVGCGKTLVAALSLARVVEAAYQGAFLAPTDLLAHQHFHTLYNIFSPHGIRIALLTGKTPPKKHQEVRDSLEKGEIDIIVGTHALIQERVRFSKLALAIIDEQHRFGVEQRLALSQKGAFPHILTMTATPIPRTLHMAMLGDLDVTTITEKPEGRLPIKTTLHSLEKIDAIIQKLKETLSPKNKAYWVCPLIEESEKMDLIAAKERFSMLSGLFQDRVGLLHGKMKPSEKDAVMQAFSNGDLELLVSTTVIEVGVDVKTANIMVIESSDRFGLAQLHQLRGRVGRSSNQGHCLLLYDKLSEVGKKRLFAMRESNDGFYLSEVDLQLRGSGDILGLKQSGLKDFRFYPKDHPEVFHPILTRAYDDAKRLMDQWDILPKTQKEALRSLMKLYKKDDVTVLKNAG